MQLSIHRVKDLYWYKEVGGITLIVDARDVCLLVDVFGDEVKITNVPRFDSPTVYTGVGAAFHGVTELCQERRHGLPSGTEVSNVLIRDRDGEHRITLFWQD